MPNSDNQRKKSVMNQFDYFSTHLKPLISAVFVLIAFCSHDVGAHGNTPPSLQGVAIPYSPGLTDGANPLVVNKQAAIQLGKALFWDTNVGSDGMACASCHFHAGADNRVQNQVSTGSFHQKPSGLTFEAMASGGQGGTNYLLKRKDFPLHQLSNPKDKDSAVLFTTDDIVSSAGVFSRRFNSVASAGTGIDDCTSVSDPVFHAGGLNTRKVQPRQAPSVINAGFNFRNFWDGRANNIFNGVSPFGSRDVKAGIWVLQQDGTVRKQTLRLENAALASQAVAPPLNDSEMSCSQRTFPDIARKLLTRQPLEKQQVHPQDSVLAELVNPSGLGLNTSYQQLIKAAFASRYWAGNGDFGRPANVNAAPYQHIEANFSLFFGLALQLYQETLISDQTPFDSPRLANTYPEIPQSFNRQQTRGLKVFLNAHCAICHRGPTLSSAAHPDVYSPAHSFASLQLVNRKTLNGAFIGKGVIQGLMDEGYFNTSVAPEDNDPGVGGTDPFGHPLSFSQQYIQKLLDGKAMVDSVAVNSCDLDNPFLMDFKDNELRNDPYLSGRCDERDIYAKIPTVSVLQAELQRKKPGRIFVAVNGAFKVPSLRNVELTGPYMHNGSLATLEQVVDFYFRGGNFKNTAHFATLVFPQPITAQEKLDLVAFLKALTDERVRWERAPFDHPQLTVPHGHRLYPDAQHPQQAEDLFLTLPAVGKNGRDPSLGPLKSFQSYLK
jgi:cytochrome c peroxidase